MDSERRIMKRSSSKRNNIVYNFIVTILAATILLIESIYILLSAFKTGFLKKEVLTNRSNVGFDIVIKSN
tara:strand:- start:1113 stop:1322 length:210 start_codon:yes stop_codon:yes gene_type:complete